MSFAAISRNSIRSRTRRGFVFIRKNSSVLLTWIRTVAECPSAGKIGQCSLRQSTRSHFSMGSRAGSSKKRASRSNRARSWNVTRRARGRSGKWLLLYVVLQPGSLAGNCRTRRRATNTRHEKGPRGGCPSDGSARHHLDHRAVGRNRNMHRSYPGPRKGHLVRLTRSNGQGTSTPRSRQPSRRHVLGRLVRSRPPDCKSRHLDMYPPDRSHEPSLLSRCAARQSPLLCLVGADFGPHRQ